MKKFKKGDFVFDKKNKIISEIIDVDYDESYNKGYAFENVFGRKIWIDAEHIEKTHKLYNPFESYNLFEKDK